MAYDSRVYRVLIASPSDVEEEREIAVRVIQEWNDLYSFARKITLLPLRWETHTAPEYGTRPQEVINRAIVDHCDLLVGIFWTRIGSPTGVADSGTLEEIQRVGNSAKPVMLYFSRIPIDPDSIDVGQNERLKQFKANTYPKGLVESYKSLIEFRDKFSKQLELKVRDLQSADASGQVPISLHFISVDQGELEGNIVTKELDMLSPVSFDMVPVESQKEIENKVGEHIKSMSYIPLPLAIRNENSSGLRNLYVEIEVKSSSKGVELTEHPISSPFAEDVLLWLSGSWGSEKGIKKQVDEKLSKFTAEKLQKTEKGWEVSIEWDAIQPQRTRLIKPILYVYSRETAEIELTARVFADSLPEAIVLSAKMNIQVNYKDVDLEDIAPEWRKLLKKNDGRLKQTKFVIPTAN